MDKNVTYLGDCLELMPKHIKDKSIDLILCDLPYGTTNCKWDSIISLEDNVNGVTYDNFFIDCFKYGYDFQEANYMWNKQKTLGLWSHYNRIIKDNGVILLFAQTPFDKVLGESNLKMLRYEWIWEKTSATGHLNAKKMPMKAHENILVFYKKLPVYNPQKTTGHKPANFRTKKVEVQNNTEVYGKVNKEHTSGGYTDRYPRSVLTFPSDKQKNKLHSTQKPLALCEYMVKTYSNPGDLVLDNTAGSGTTGLAAKNLGRDYIMIEKDPEIFEICKNRVK